MPFIERNFVGNRPISDDIALAEAHAGPLMSIYHMYDGDVRDSFAARIADNCIAERRKDAARVAWYVRYRPFREVIRIDRWDLRVEIPYGCRVDPRSVAPASLRQTRAFFWHAVHELRNRRADALHDITNIVCLTNHASAELYMQVRFMLEQRSMLHVLPVYAYHVCLFVETTAELDPTFVGMFTKSPAITTVLFCQYFFDSPINELLQSRVPITGMPDLSYSVEAHLARIPWVLRCLVARWWPDSIPHFVALDADSSLANKRTFKAPEDDLDPALAA